MTPRPSLRAARDGLLARHASPAVLVACLLGLTACGGGSGDATAAAPPTSAAPSLTTQPQDTTVRAGTAATFTAAATAAPGTDLRYQWLRDGTPIAGATAASHTTDPLTTTDDGARYSVVVTGPGGSTTSASARVAVTSSLSGRGWTGGTLLSPGIDRVTGIGAGIADDGTVWTVLARTVGGSGLPASLHAIRGRPGTTPGAAPTWSTAERIDTGIAASFGGLGPFGVAVSPKGSVLVHWMVREPCAARTPTFVPSGNQETCWWLYATRRLHDANAWEQARPITALPISGVLGRINDAGDVVLAFTGWTTAAGRPTPDRSEDLRLAIARWPGGATSVAITPTTWRASPFTESTPLVRLGLDNRGGVILAAESIGSTNVRDIVTWRAGMTGPVEGPETLDRRNDDAVLGDLVVGTRGDAVVHWRQSDGRNAQAGWAATRRPGDAAWSIREGGFEGDRRVAATVGDDGWIRLIEGVACRLHALRPGQSTWSPPLDMPRMANGNCAVLEAARPLGHADRTLTRDANYLYVHPGRRWLSGDGGLNRVIQRWEDTAAPYVVGTAADPVIGPEMAIPLLSRSGIGAWIVTWRLSTLPNSAQPLGELSGKTEAWGMFLQ